MRRTECAENGKGSNKRRRRLPKKSLAMSTALQIVFDRNVIWFLGNLRKTKPRRTTNIDKEKRLFLSLEKK